MKFTEHLNPGVNLIRSYEPNCVSVNQQQLCQSCVISQHHLLSDWPVTQLSDLDESAMQMLIELKPEVLILGTGEQQIFPSASVMQFFIQQGISLEVMSNDAACRTYNILTTEDREVVIALVMN
ncbi:Mth938-like domain-containing protein [Thiomicrospira cyclica]|uniref:Xcc1710-like domain-containing protein n=1 Tax=Thiomicrospira cyclica (strain DSM 14477 / JCM 11371 / ALM1) TaxID=717773 RepID=F6DCA3_THICA|nr:Mth938-like domain-containing protein [Thiomicrospira cyclica]AEG31489.1 protein of unknown function DUF498 [Thiomicrospira cyclica ALM1]